MKKYIHILILFLSIPGLIFGQDMTVKKLPEFKIPYAKDYALFQASADQHYTKCINSDRASVRKSPMVNSQELNELALQRALSYAEYIVGVESSGIDTTANPEYLMLPGHEFFVYKRNPHYGSTGPENARGNWLPAGYKIGYDLGSVTEKEMLEKNLWLVRDGMKQSESGIRHFYLTSPGHLDTRRNTGGGWEKKNWGKYGYAVVYLLIEGPNPFYINDSDCICMPTRINQYMITFEVFSE